MLIGKYPRYLSFIGCKWDKQDFKIFEFWKTSLGWRFNIWRLMVSYDSYVKFNKR